MHDWPIGCTDDTYDDTTALSVVLRRVALNIDVSNAIVIEPIENAIAKSKAASVDFSRMQGSF